MIQKKPELLTTAGTLEEVERLFQAGADAVNVGSERYALRMPGDFDLPQLQEAVRIARHFNGKVYVSINALLHNDDLLGLDQYVSELDRIGVDGIVFGDPAVFMSVRNTAPGIALHWNTETTSTNFRTVNYWAKKGVARAVLSRELSLQEVLDIKRNTGIEVQAQVHGMTCIFHSKRNLVSNYMQHLGEKAETKDCGQDRSMFLQADKHEEQQYPIFEDVHGTHVMSSEDICMIEHLGLFLDAGVDALKIEGILKPAEYNETVVSIYRQAIDRFALNPKAKPDPGWLREIVRVQPKNRPLGTGFYFKEQIY